MTTYDLITLAELYPKLEAENKALKQEIERLSTFIELLLKLLPQADLIALNQWLDLYKKEKGEENNEL